PWNFREGQSRCRDRDQCGAIPVEDVLHGRIGNNPIGPVVPASALAVWRKHPAGNRLQAAIPQPGADMTGGQFDAYRLGGTRLEIPRLKEATQPPPLPRRGGGPT